MIEVKNLSKKYGQHLAIDNISFSLERGEILGFLGPNGAGKTTTMRILTCFQPPSSGSVKICGFDVEQQALEVKRKIGYLPEHPPLYGEMTPYYYLKFVAKLKGIGKKEIKERIDWVVEKCSLNAVTNRLIENLSKGYKQRVGIAQAIINKPEVLILDEPTIGLDPKQIREIRQLIKELGKEHTIILSTHILPEVTMTCQQGIIINNGKIVAQGSIESLSQGKTLEEAFLELISGERSALTPESNQQ